jgi:hypothetical protein
MNRALSASEAVEESVFNPCLSVVDLSPQLAIPDFMVHSSAFLFFWPAGCFCLQRAERVLQNGNNTPVFWSVRGLFAGDNTLQRQHLEP